MLIGAVKPERPGDMRAGQRPVPQGKQDQQPLRGHGKHDELIPAAQLEAVQQSQLPVAVVTGGT